MRLVCGTDGCDVGLRSDNRSGRSMLCAQREWRRKRQNERLRSDPEWAEHVHQCARLAAQTSIALDPGLVNDTDLRDWRSHMSMRERRLIEAAMSANVWEPGHE